MPFFAVTEALGKPNGGRRRGGLRALRGGVWRTDAELPPVDGARRRGLKTVRGIKDDAEATHSRGF